MWECAGAKDTASEFESRGFWKGWRGWELEKGGSRSWGSERGLENCAWVRFANTEFELKVVQISRSSRGPRGRRRGSAAGAVELKVKTGAVVPSEGPTTRRRSAMAHFASCAFFLPFRGTKFHV